MCASLGFFTDLQMQAALAGELPKDHSEEHIVLKQDQIQFEHLTKTPLQVSKFTQKLVIMQSYRLGAE